MSSASNTLAVIAKYSRDGAGSGSVVYETRKLPPLVVAEVALAVVLVAGGGLLFRSFVAQTQVDPGFDAENVVILALQLEAGFDASLRDGLAGLGHEVTVVPNVAGGMNGVLIDDGGVMTGAACWRADGSPAALAGGRADVAARFNPLV